MGDTLAYLLAPWTKFHKSNYHFEIAHTIAEANGRDLWITKIRVQKFVHSLWRNPYTKYSLRVDAAAPKRKICFIHVIITPIFRQSIKLCIQLTTLSIVV